MPLRHYIAYRWLQNVASAIFQPPASHQAILLCLRLDPDTMELKG
ncbi:hypothetical protein GCM10018790_00530 [Kitasatospora xanthocidica]|nr:hypothetical protein [Kitasatospora xanthocidica]GHF27160.1 hypothetical protein GCM10018790_00530 [Kitasatospora xanthocidica]